MNEKRFRKRVDEVKGNMKNVPFTTIDAIIRYCGYEVRQPSGGSTHYSYRKSGCRRITIPYKRPFIGEHYIRDALRILGLEGE